MWSPWRDYLYLVHRLLEDVARRRVAQLAGGRVLDLGCGAAPYREFLPATATHIGVDHLPLPGVKALATGEALPFADASFDGALCTEVLVYSPHPAQFCAELARVLKPGARLYLTAPFDWHLMASNDYFRFTPAGVRALLGAAGFRVESLEPVGGLFSATAGKLLENLFRDVWQPLTRALGIKRGAYLSAALMTLPFNVAAVQVAPLFDRLTPRSPISFAVSAVRSPA